MMTVRNILHWFFSYPQAIASVADRAERGLIGANPTGFCTGGLGEISPNKASKWRHNQNAILIVYGHLPCLAGLAQQPKSPIIATV